MLKELRTRIASVKATRKITQAMRMVAASKLRRAQEAALAARPYATTLTSMVARLAAGAEASGSPPPLLVGTGKEQNHLLVVITADRGLCGGFNSSIVRFVRRHARKLTDEGKDVKMLCIGNKGYAALMRHWSMVGEPLPAEPSSIEVCAEKLDEMYAAGAFDVATVCYAQFTSVMVQEPSALRLIPVEAPEQEEERMVFDYEPEQDQLLASLLPRFMRVELMHALRENAAGEQGARMTAMDSASRNAGEMMDRLTLVYNRTRQAMITRELVEIISGAEAL